MTTYLLQGGESGAARLTLLAGVHQSDTERLLDRLRLSPPVRCLDVGCGSGAVTRLLAARFAQGGGSALGVDIDPHYLDVARAETPPFGVPAQYESVSAQDLAFAGEFDLVYSRFLLSHLAEPREALRRMIRAAKPGGTVAIEDVDFGGAFSYPPSRDFERYLAWYDALTRRNGGNPDLGRELFAMASDLGLSGVGVATAQPAFASAAGKDLPVRTLEHIGRELVARGLASASELEETLAGLRTYAEAPTTVLSMPRVFQVWGRVT